MLPVFLDYETHYSKEYSLKKMSTQEYIYSPHFKVHGAGVAIGKNPPQWFSGARLDLLLSKLVPGNVIVCHNAGFDAAILNWHYGLKPKLIIDTISLSRALIGERLRSHSLDSIAKFLLGQEKGGFLSEVMGVRDLTPEQERQLAAYCLHDVDLCRQIFYKLIPHIPKKELLVMDWVSRCYTEPCLLLDPTLLKEYHAEVVAKRLRSLDDAGVASAKELRSNPQFADALRALGVDPPMKTSPTSGEPAYAFAKTDEGLMALQEHPDERVQALVAARLENRSTLAETRAENFITAQKYGAFPIGYLFSGAMTTHRLSGGGGNNLQNLPRGGALRRAIMAPIRHTLVVGDQAQVELRITLALAVALMAQLGVDVTETEEYKALRILEAGGDLYGTFGTTIYQKTITKENTPLERQIAKSAVLGLGFGMGKDKFIAYCKQQGIAVNEDFAQYVVKLYRGTYSGVVRLWRYMQDRIKAFIADTDTSLQLFKEPNVWVRRTTLSGDAAVGLEGALQIKYPGLRYDAENNQFLYDRAIGPAKLFAGKYVENLVQYLARQIIVEQTVRVNKRYKVAMSTHDEIVCVVPRDEKEEAMVWVKQIMEAPVAWWPSLPLGAEVKSNDRYGNAK